MWQHFLIHFASEYRIRNFSSVRGRLLPFAGVKESSEVYVVSSEAYSTYSTKRAGTANGLTGGANNTANNTA